MARKIAETTSDASCELLAGFFMTVAHPTRMSIFCGLQQEPRSVTSIASQARITITNASQHLRIMREKGAVVSEKRGQSVYYRIADQRFLDAANLIHEALDEQMRERARSKYPVFKNSKARL